MAILMIDLSTFFIYFIVTLFIFSFSNLTFLFTLAFKSNCFSDCVIKLWLIEVFAFPENVDLNSVFLESEILQVDKPDLGGI